MARIEVLETEDVAEELHLKKHTLEVWRCLGRGPRYRKFGGRVYYLRTDVDDFVAASVRTSTSDPGEKESVT